MSKCVCENCPPGNPKCPGIVCYPWPYETYKCEENSLFINYYVSKLLVNAPYFSYISTAVRNSPEYRKKYSFIVPIYTFKYYSINDPTKLLKTYNYEQVFVLSLVADQYKSLALVPNYIKDNWDEADKEFYSSILLFDNVDKLFNAVRFANEYRQYGKDYFFTYTLPVFVTKIPQNQIRSKCYSRDELITLSRIAPNIVENYEK